MCASSALVRDGRAVALDLHRSGQYADAAAPSPPRRRSGESRDARTAVAPAEAAHEWRRSNEEAAAIAVPPRSAAVPATVSYEDLCADTPVVLRRVFGVPRGRQPFRSGRGLARAHPPRRSATACGFDSTEEVRLDDRWKTAFPTRGARDFRRRSRRPQPAAWIRLSIRPAAADFDLAELQTVCSRCGRGSSRTFPARSRPARGGDSRATLHPLPADLATLRQSHRQALVEPQHGPPPEASSTRTPWPSCRASHCSSEMEAQRRSRAAFNATSSSSTIVRRRVARSRSRRAPARDRDRQAAVAVVLAGHDSAAGARVPGEAAGGGTVAPQKRAELHRLTLTVDGHACCGRECSGSTRRHSGNLK